MTRPKPVAATIRLPAALNRGKEIAICPEHDKFRPTCRPSQLHAENLTNLTIELSVVLDDA
jgi:hypothetical protein